MKLTGKILICLAAGLAFATSLRADDVLLPGNPYAPAVARNIFSLNPPPPVDPNAATAEPPVKITPNGITDILGQMQALFKVAGKPPGQDGYILTEGQRQDDIEVTKIDEKTGVVTFNNHGIVQALPLVAATPSSSAAPVASFRNATLGGGNSGANGFNNRFGNRGGNFPGRNPRGGNGGGANGGNNSGTDDGSALGNVPTRYGSQQPAVDPVVQTVLIEANRAVAQQQGDPTAKIFPKTEMTPPDSGDGTSPQ